MTGGLGNQMFKYAAVKALSLKNGCPLKIDISQLIEHRNLKGDFTARNYELSIFPNIKEKVIDIKRQHLPLHLRTLLKKAGFLYVQNKILRERTFSFDEDITQAVAPVIIEGDLQSEYYFKDYSNEIIKAFKFPSLNKQSTNASIESEIVNCESVSVHIRRSDYLNPSILALNGICSMGYNKNAIEAVKQKIENPTFYFFSDDPEWVKRELVHLVDKFHVVEGNRGSAAWVDMYLMSLCKHNIIANSSFSWWGAWLNRNTDKMVIAPEKWFATTDPYFNTKDLIPQTWLKI